MNQNQQHRQSHYPSNRPCFLHAASFFHIQYRFGSSTLLWEHDRLFMPSIHQIIKGIARKGNVAWWVAENSILVDPPAGKIFGLMVFAPTSDNIIQIVDAHSERRIMREKKPQFLRMNANREENPPHREVTCPDYRNCLTEAAFKNFSLDCSLCTGEPTTCSTSAANEVQLTLIGSTPALQGLPG
jgi:arylamine N-acetyltransferase